MSNKAELAVEEKVVRTSCAMCHGGCGLLVRVRNGKIVMVEGDPENPLSKGMLCPQGLAARQFVYHPDRLKYPMRRTGQRGERKWERISWDEALDVIAAKIKEIREKDGPLAVAASCGTGRPISPYLRRFISAWGTPNRLSVPHNCMTPKLAIGAIRYGKAPGPDMENSACIVAWGSNMTHTRRGLCKMFIAGFKKGAKTICIDPYLTPMASKADIWLQLRPGTDCAVALAWLNVIIAEGLYDKEFVDKWTYGFDRLTEHVREFTPEWAEEITWVPAGEIRRAAQMYATTRPASIMIGVAPEFGVNTTNTVSSIFLLPALTGNVDVPGSNVFWESPVPDDHHRKVFGFHLITRENWESAVGGFPLILLGHPAPGYAGWQAVITGKPYPIRAVLVHAANPLVGHENPRELVYKAIMKLDFISVMDHFMTPTAELADIVLPASTWLERDDIQLSYSGNFWNPIVGIPRVIEPLWESRDDTDVFIEILKRVGLDFGFNNKKEMLDYTLEPQGITYDELKVKGWLSVPQRWRKYEQGLLSRDGKPGFNTPSGKVELYSQTLEKMGLDPLPTHKEPPESPISNPELLEEYPLVLTTGIRSPVYFHTQYRQLPWLREIHPDPIVRINPRAAEKFGIKDGDWVYIESPRGKCKQKAKLTLGIDPRVVLAEHGWWFPEKPAPEYGVWDSNINLLVSSEPPYDPGLGSTPARSLLCKIYKAEQV